MFCEKQKNTLQGACWRERETGKKTDFFFFFSPSASKNLHQREGLRNETLLPQKDAAFFFLLHSRGKKKNAFLDGGRRVFPIHVGFSWGNFAYQNKTYTFHGAHKVFGAALIEVCFFFFLAALRRKNTTRKSEIRILGAVVRYLIIWMTTRNRGLLL